MRQILLKLLDWAWSKLTDDVKPSELEKMYYALLYKYEELKGKYEQGRAY